MAARTYPTTGAAVTLTEDRPAWYSGYGANPERTIAAGEPLTVQFSRVVPVRGRRDYIVGQTADGWQVSFYPGEYRNL